MSLSKAARSGSSREMLTRASSAIGSTGRGAGCRQVDRPPSGRQPPIRCIAAPGLFYCTHPHSLAGGEVARSRSFLVFRSRFLRFGLLRRAVLALRIVTLALNALPFDVLLAVLLRLQVFRFADGQEAGPVAVDSCAVRFA